MTCPCSLLEAYDDNVFATLGGTRGSEVTRPVERVLHHAAAWRRLSVDTASSRRLASLAPRRSDTIPDFGEVRSISHNLGAGLSLQLAGRDDDSSESDGGLLAVVSVRTVSNAADADVPGDAMPDAPNYAVNDVESYAYGTTATLSHGLSRRTTASRSAGTIATRISRTRRSFSGLRRRRGSTDSCRISALVTLALRLRISLSDRESRIRRRRSSTNENRLEGGLSYSRPLSATRRMTFSFNLGSSAVSTQRCASGTPGARSSVSCVRRRDRSITSSRCRGRRVGRIRRGLEFVPGLAQPVYHEWCHGRSGRAAESSTRDWICRWLLAGPIRA